MKSELIALVACAACKAAPAHDDAPRARDVGSNADAAAAAAVAWPELATFPHVEPLHIVMLPAKAATPKFDLAGPVVAAGIAVVASSQFGFAAVDVARGTLAWTKPAGLHVAPPLARGNAFTLIGACVNAPDVPATDQLLGCARVVTPTGADQSYVAIHGRTADVAAFATELGPQRVDAATDRTLVWRRGDRAVTVDQITGIATPAPAIDPPLVIHYKERTWQIARGDDGIIAATGHPPWHTQRPYTALLGAVYLPGQSPMVRVSNVGHFGGLAEMNLMDIDATGSMHGQVAFPVPGIGLAAHAIDSIGDVALAVNLDASLERDFIVGYAANALLMWVYPLPRVPRADPIGLAVAPDVVVVFHDGDIVTVLPELSAPPTAPGAARVPSENATP